MITIKRLTERYNIIDTISNKNGYMVYLGYDDITASKVIIKEIPKTAAKLDNDFSVLRKLHHPGLPDITDAFEMNESMYTVIEYIQGDNLKNLIDKNGVFNEKEALGIAEELLKTLDYLHSIKPRPLIHGDIKPENIIIRNGSPVLVDFGSTGTDSGTSGFCAPERFAGFIKNIKSDIYSAGCILYYLLSGENKKIYGRSKSNGISNQLYSVIDKSTKKIASERYDSAAAILTEIQRVIKLKAAGIDGENQLNIICVPGCPEAACEMAYSISLQGKKVLVADLDMLSPGVHLLMSKDRLNYSLTDFLMGEPSSLKDRCSVIGKGTLYILPSITDYGNFESAGDDCLQKLIAGASGFVDTVVISCSRFPYDKYFMDSIVYSSITVFPVVKGVIDLRSYNSLAGFLVNRRNVNKNKMFFMGMNICGTNIGGLIAAGAVETNWIGSVPYSQERCELYSSGRPYIFSMKKKIYSRYMRILNKTGVFS